MPGPGGPRVILGVGFWAQQEYFGILPGPDGTKIFRPILKSLPDQPPPPNAFQSWTWSYNLNLIGQDQMIVGEQRWELPPSQTPYELIRNFTWQWNTPLSLYFQAPGQPLVGAMWDVLPPAHFVPYRIDQTWTWSYNKNLIGKDAMVTGAQVTDLAPSQKPPEQVQLHAWQWSYNLNLIGKDRLPTGEQVYDRPALPAPPAFTFTFQIQALLTPLGPLGLVANKYDWPIPRPYVYNIDIASVTRSYNLNLIGQDKLPTGAVFTETPRQPAPQPPWTQPYNVALYFVPPFVDTTKIFRGHLRSLPDQGPPRLDQTWTRSVNLNLIAPPPDLTKQARQQDWPNPIGPAPTRDWIQQTNLALLVQPPAFLPALSNAARSYDLAPSQLPPEQVQLHSWQWSYNLNLIGKDQLPVRQTDWPLTPAAQRGVDLSTWIDRTKAVLLARPFAQYDWPNPGQPARDPTLATVARGYTLELLGQDRLPIGAQSSELPPRDFLRALQTWIESTDLVLTTAPPDLTKQVRQQDWPLPIGFPPWEFFTAWSSSLNLPLNGVITPPLPPTELPGTGGPEVGRYRPIFRDVICRLEELKAERDRRRGRHGLLTLEHAVKTVIGRMPLETRHELAPEIGQIGEALESTAAVFAPEFEARIAIFFTALAQEIDDEEAWLLLNQ